MIIKKCTKCNSNNLIAVNNGNHVGLYCADCGAWLKWINKKEYPLYKALREEKNG